MSDDFSTGWVDVGVACGPFVVALWGPNSYVLSLDPYAAYADCLSAARDAFGAVHAPMAIMATNGLPQPARRGTPQLTALDGWTLLDRITAESYASDRRTVNEFAAYVEPQPEGLTQVYGEDTADETYRLVCDPSGTCTVLADINEDGDVTPDLEAGGLWTFRVGGLGDFDAPDLGRRTYNLPEGTLVEAQDADGETPTIQAYTVAQAAPATFDPLYPYPVEDAVIGMLERDADNNLALNTGSRTDVDGPFGGRVVYVEEELGYGSGIKFSGSNGPRSTSVYAEFARPRTPLLDDDGASIGQWFVGVEVVATQCRRHTGWVEQADPYSEAISGDTEYLITSSDFPQADELGGYGPANVDNYPRLGITGNPYYHGNFFPPDTNTPSVGGFARCQGFAQILAYRDDWPSGLAPGGRFATVADPHCAYIAVATAPGLLGTPPTRIVGNPFQWVETTWRFRAVYITRTVQGNLPSVQTGDTRGTGGALTYSAWSNEKTFCYCPATNSCVHVQSRNHDFSYRHASQSRTVSRYGLIYHDDGTATQKASYGVTITGDTPPNDADIQFDFDAVPNATGYTAIVTRFGGTRGVLNNERYITAPAYVKTGNETEPYSWNLGKSNGWTLSGIMPGGTLNFNGAAYMGVLISPIIGAYANGSRNVGDQCPGKGIYGSSTGGDEPLCPYPICDGYGGVSQPVWGGWDGTGTSSRNVIGNVCGSADGTAKMKVWIVIPGSPYDSTGHPITPVDTYVPISTTENGDNQYPYPLGRPEAWPLGVVPGPPFNGTDYDATNSANQALLKGAPWVGCSLLNIEHVKAWKGHVLLWTAKRGQDVPKFPASSQTVTLLDGTHAYWAASVIDGWPSLIHVDNVVGYDDQEQIPAFEKLDDRIQKLIDQLPEAVRERVEAKLGQGEIGSVLVEPVVFDGPFLCYLNSDGDLINSPVEVAGFAGATQNFVGIPPASAPPTGGVYEPVGLLGTLTYLGVTCQVYDRPQLKA